VTLVTGFVAVAILYLLAAYAVGGPAALARRLLTALSRRRLRYRPPQDDAIANSRFTIPVSVIVYSQGEADVAASAAHLLALDYPEFEVIVVNDGSLAALTALRERFDLNACEIFFRRSLETSPVRAIYRSLSDPRLLVLDCAVETRGDALNCGANLARFRYICCADLRARFNAGALLESMHAAVEDPALVVGVTTTLGPPPDGGDESPQATRGLWHTLERLSASRTLLARGGWRSLSLRPEGLPGLMLWRRDALIDVGGFARDIGAEQVELTFRMHRHHLAANRAYRIVHIAEPIGAPANDEMLAELAEEQEACQRALGAVLWRYRTLLFNPRYGYLGLVGLPRFVFSALIVPWFELVCLAALPIAPLVGVVTGRQLLLLLAALALGNAVLLNTALLSAPAGAHDAAVLRRFILLGPVELFISRPVQLYVRLSGMLRMLARSAAAPAG
jgi:cellulose synthase/poly-beta-1,6-N-acetylglucosamine synthase-like glycosyltransferase